MKIRFRHGAPQTEYSTVHAGFREIDWNAGVPACMSAKHEQRLPRGALVQRFLLTRIGRIKRIYADLRNLSIFPCVPRVPCIPWLFSSNPNHGSHGTRGTHGSNRRQSKRGRPFGRPQASSIDQRQSRLRQKIEAYDLIVDAQRSGDESVAFISHARDIRLTRFDADEAVVSNGFVIAKTV